MEERMVVFFGGAVGERLEEEECARGVERERERQRLWCCGVSCVCSTPLLCETFEKGILAF
jgi:hypothetical protein